MIQNILPSDQYLYLLHLHRSIDHVITIFLMRVSIAKFLIVRLNRRARLKTNLMDKSHSFSTWVGSIENTNSSMTQWCLVISGTFCRTWMDVWLSHFVHSLPYNDEICDRPRINYGDIVNTLQNNLNHLGAEVRGIHNIKCFQIKHQMVQISNVTRLQFTCKRSILSTRLLKHLNILSGNNVDTAKEKGMDAPFPSWTPKNIAGRAPNVNTRS